MTVDNLIYKIIKVVQQLQYFSNQFLSAMQIAIFDQYTFSNYHAYFVVVVVVVVVVVRFVVISFGLI